MLWAAAAERSADAAFERHGGFVVDPAYESGAASDLAPQSKSARLALF
jgi:hypothetical protein